MPRPPSAYWHAGNLCWASDVGERLPSGRRRPVYFRDIPPGPKNSPGWRKAQAALAEFLRGREAREEAADHASLATVCRLYLLWLQARVEGGRAKPLTLRSHRLALKKFNAAEAPGGGRMAERPAATLAATDMAAVIGRRAEAGHKPNYLARIVASVQGALNRAADPLAGRDPERLIPANPIKGFSHEATRAPHSPDRYAEESEVRAFLDWGYRRAEAIGGLAGRFERLTIDLVRVSYLCGTRPGELRIAEWGDFDPRATRVDVGGAEEWWGKITLDPKRWKSGGKTGKPREVFLPPEAVGVIEAIRSLDGHHPRYIWTHRRGTRAAGRGAVEASHGEVWTDSSLPTKVCNLRRRAIEAGVQLQDAGHDRFTMYRLRHTRAAELLMGGVDVATVARLLGTSVAMIERTYGSFTGSHLAGAAARGLGRATASAAPAAGEG